MVILDLVDKAAEASWKNGYVDLPWATDDGGVSVKNSENVTLVDGKVTPRVIEVSPRRPQGAVTGRFANVTIPAEGAQVRTGFSFLQGGGSGGAYFSAVAEFPGAEGLTPLQRDYYWAESYHSVMDDFHFDLARFAGMTGTIGLSVEAADLGANAVWLNTQLVSLAGEYPFPEYVGGAVGSGLAGNSLLNPWGGKSGVLFGEIWLVLEFRNTTDTYFNYALELESVYEGVTQGRTNLGSVSPGQTTFPTSLMRTQHGRWAERIIFNGTYSGEVRYTVNEAGE